MKHTPVVANAKGKRGECVERIREHGGMSALFGVIMQEWRHTRSVDWGQHVTMTVLQTSWWQNCPKSAPPSPAFQTDTMKIKTANCVGEVGGAQTFPSTTQGRRRGYTRRALRNNRDGPCVLFLKTPGGVVDHGYDLMVPLWGVNPVRGVVGRKA